MTELLTTGVAHERISGSIAFSNPEWLWLIAPLLIVLIFWRVIGSRHQPANIALGNTNLRHRVLHPLIFLIPKNDSINKTPLLNIVVYGVAMASLVISLADPVRIGEKLPDPPQERDIIFIVDTSISMTLRDYVLDGKRIDRMTLLKGVLDEFIQKFPGERIGIIIFGDAAYTLVPLTRDQNLIRRMLSRIQATMVGRFNNIGEAIALAVKQSRQQAEDKRHRVLVLLTDADKPTGTIDPQTAAELAVEADIPLYTIAIGAPTAAAEEKRITGLIYEPVDSALLATISEHTGGRNYQAGDAEALKNAVNDISLNETNKRILLPLFHHESLYYWPLLFSVALLLIFNILTILQRLLTADRPQLETEVENTRQ